MTPQTQIPCLIGLGSNVGNRLQNLQNSIDSLKSIGKILAISRVVESAPMYKTDQEMFLNAAAILATDFAPAALLGYLKRTETALGRIPRERNGPREIDLDLLTYGSLILTQGENLIIPHPRLTERPFVLIPLADIAPETLIPSLGTPNYLLALTKDPWKYVQLYKSGNLSL